MHSLRLLVYLLVSPWAGFAQSYTLPPGSPQKKSPQYPIANQFEHLSVKDGLSNNSVTCILQDRDDFMWFGTTEGLNKYDGHTFTIFKPDPKQPGRSFRHSSIRGLCEGPSDQLWVITKGGGLHEVNRKTGVVTPHPVRAANAERWNNQNSVYKDSQDRIWVTSFGGLACYEPARHHFTLFPAPEADASISAVFEDRQHRFWVGTVRGLYRLNPKTGRFTPVPVAGIAGSQPYFDSFYQDSQDRLWLGTATEGYSLFRLNLRQQPWQLIPYNPAGKLSPYVWRNSIHQDSTGLVWAGTTNGLYAIDPVKDEVVAYSTDPNQARSLSSSNAQAIYHDRSNAIWVGTDNGIDRQGVNTKPFQTYRLTPNERMANIPRNRVKALYKDTHGQLWFTNAATVYRLSANQQRLDSLPPEKIGSVGSHRNAIHTIISDGVKGIWFGTADGLYHYDPAADRYTAYAARIPVQYIALQSIDRTSMSHVWVGGEGGIASFSPLTHQYTYYTHQPGHANGLTGHSVNGLMVSQFGEVWVLIKELGICRLNTKTGQFTRYMAGSNGQLNCNDVVSIYEAQDGLIWIGTHLGGVNQFNWRTGLFSAITPKDGVPGTTVVGVTSDESGNLWLSTDQGLCRVDPNTKAIHRYEQSDGLPSNEFLPNAIYRQSGQLMIGSVNGLVQFYPDHALDDTRPFPVRITQLSVLDKPRLLTDSVIRLNHDENRVAFSFAALSYEQPAHNQYAYQLVGVDKNWIQNGNRPEATYTSLPSGTYTFRVKAANSSGFWTPNQAAIQVIVYPPWWVTWWAYGLYALLMGGAIWSYIRFYTNRLQQQQESALNRRESEQLKALDELKSRFFSNITHEFRTPLSLIISPVEKLLQEERFDRSTLTLVHRNAEQLLRLINQLLDLSKLEGHHMTVSLMQGQVADFITHVVDRFREATEQKGVTLTCAMTHLPAQEHVFDADKWGKVLSNLLANAIKFTPSGGQISLTVEPTGLGEEMTGIQLQLVDTGIGIGAQHLPHIFDRFYQADASSTRAYEGTGIGLALTHELVQLLGGTIQATSELTVGTTFQLTLPVQSVAARADLPRISWVPTRPTGRPSLPSVTLVDQASTEESGRVPSLLIVEDNDELREFLVSELTGTYTLLQARDGEAGWSLARLELPDLVLTDVMMPRMDGNELTRLIKEHPDTNHIAVVMLTAKAAQQSRIAGLQQGADDYLSKPFSMTELQLRLHNLVVRQQKLGDYYRQQFALSTDEPVIEMIQNPFLDRIYALMDQHLDDASINVDWLADQMGMSRKTLYRKVQHFIQLSPTDLIRQYRLRKAADLLRAGKNVVETADLVGFSTPSHFSIFFKEFYQQTPSEFIGKRSKNL